MRRWLRHHRRGPHGPLFHVVLGVCVILAVVVGAGALARVLMPIQAPVAGVAAPVREVHRPARVVPTELPEGLDVVPVAPPAQGVSVGEPSVGVFKPLKPVQAAPLPRHWVWKDHAQPVPPHAKTAPLLAILLDDMGDVEEGTTTLKPTNTTAVETLPVGVSFAFFPWYEQGFALADVAHAKGHEIWVHMPMEPLKHGETVFDPGANALMVGMPPEEIVARIRRNMQPLAHVAVGFNNHMGSRFTKDVPGMRVVLEEAQRQGVAFVDSRTAGHTAVAEAARGLVLPLVARDVFLDDVPNRGVILHQLQKAVALARTRGYALAIGHPLPDTLAVLEENLSLLEAQGVVLVPVSALIGRR